MDWLNYHHLLYFWTVAREGTVARAAQVLRLAQPTISGQVRALETSLGEKLFVRVGRRLALTDVGEVVYRYADEIFALGRELSATVKGLPTGRPLRVRVGIADAMPKFVAYRLLEPALRMPEPLLVVCRDGTPDRLLARLSVHELDLVLSDAPIGPGAHVRAFNHLLGECGVTFFAAPAVARTLARRFPKSLDGAPFLVPAEGSALRRSLDQWFESQAIRPRIVAEIDDSALLKVFGQGGHGVFAAPSVVEAQVRSQYGARPIGATAAVRERFYAISIERKLKHPAVVAISQAARTELFS